MNSEMSYFISCKKNLTHDWPDASDILNNKCAMVYIVRDLICSREGFV